MVEMISGVTRVGNRTYSPADGPLALDDAVEKRLVSAGVARYVKSAVVYDLNGFGDVPGAGQVETLPDAESVTEGTEMPNVAAETKNDGVEMSKANPETENDGAEAEREQTAFYDRDYLTALTNAQLKDIADGMGVDTSAMRKKADFVEAILNQQAADSGEAADDEEPPDLGAEGPVT